MAKKLYASIEKSRGLPSGYRQLEYIESSGTQYIDTGISYGSSNYNTLRMVIQNYYPTLTSPYWLVNGCSGNNGIFYVGCANSSGAVYYGNGSNINTGKTAGAGVVHEWDYNAKDGTLILDGETIATGISYSVPSGSLPIILFGYSTTTTNVDKHIERLYSCKIYDNNRLVRDFVPCVNPNEIIGLYDTVNGVFYANAGSGTFTAGSDSSDQLVYKQIKKLYADIGDGTYKKIKKLYADIDGVYKLIFAKATVWKKYKVIKTTTYEKVETQNPSSVTFQNNGSYAFADPDSSSPTPYSFNKNTGLFSPKTKLQTIAASNIGNHMKYTPKSVYFQGATSVAVNPTSRTVYTGYVSHSGNSLTGYNVNFEYMYTSQEITTNTQGDYIEDIESDDPSAYPDNGYQDGYWYVKQA